MQKFSSNNALASKLSHMHTLKEKKMLMLCLILFMRRICITVNLGIPCTILSCKKV